MAGIITGMIFPKIPLSSSKTEGTISTSLPNIRWVSYIISFLDHPYWASALITRFWSYAVGDSESWIALTFSVLEASLMDA